MRSAVVTLSSLYDALNPIPSTEWGKCIKYKKKQKQKQK